MSLTAQEETTLKKIATEKIKQDAIEAINTTCNQAVQVLQQQIEALQTKRNADITAIKNA